MSSNIFINFLEKLRELWRRKVFTNGALRSSSCSLGADVHAVSTGNPTAASSPLQLPSIDTPQESSTTLTVYRNTSDAAQTLLPPVQALVSVIPGVGGIVKGVIEGILNILQLVDRYIQNKGDLEQLSLRLHLLLRFIDNAPDAQTTDEETMRRRLLSELESAKSRLESLEKRIRGSPSVAQEISGLITTINNRLLEYMVFALMYLRHDVNEIKMHTDKIAQSSFRQMQYIENLTATGTAGQLPASISRGHAVLIDATGREHWLLLDQCSHLDQLDLMLRACLYQCTPREAKALRWYIELKKYHFVIHSRSGSAVTQLTRQSDIWSNLPSGTRIVMRAIIEEAVNFLATATYKCRCGTPNTVDIFARDLAGALKQGRAITCRHCERWFLPEESMTEDNDTIDSQKGAGTTPTKEPQYLIRHFLTKQVYVSSLPVDEEHQPPCNCKWICEDGMARGDILDLAMVPQHLVKQEIPREAESNLAFLCSWKSTTDGRDTGKTRESIARHVRDVHLRLAGDPYGATVPHASLKFSPSRATIMDQMLQYQSDEPNA